MEHRQVLGGRIIPVERINILSIDGGGMYGVVAAEALKFMYNELGALRNKFHIVAGTSTGSILGAGTLLGYTPGELQSLYFDEGPEIFKKARPKVVFGLARNAPKYKGKYLRRAIEKCFGDTTMGSLPTRLMLSAYNMTAGRTHYFRSWTDHNILLRDAVVASASAPTYHPMHRVGNQCYTDGGVFAANPVIGSVGAAYKYPGFNMNTEINVISIGTGYKAQTTECSDKVRNKGDLWWMEKLPSVFLDGMDEVPDDFFTCLDSDPASRLTYTRLDVPVVSKRNDELRLDKLNDGINRMRAFLESETGKEKLEKIIGSLS